jgi:hypothetical protein
VRAEIAPLLNSPLNTRDMLVLRQETGPGRNLALVLLLAAACATKGLTALQADRSDYDMSRVVGSKNWLSYAKVTKKTVFSRFNVNRWSNVKEHFGNEQPVSDSDEYSDSEAAELDESIVKCFQEHEVMSITTLDGVDFDLCDGCGATYSQCGQRFYRCENL